MNGTTTLLEQAISYAGRSVLDVTPALLPRPRPDLPRPGRPAPGRTGRRRLLAIAPLLIPETGRHPLFSPPATSTAQAGPGDRLVAYLGRKPATPAGPSPLIAASGPA